MSRVQPVNPLFQTLAKGNDVITKVISINQQFASTFSIKNLKFLRRDCMFSFIFPPTPLERPEKDASAKLFLGSTRHHLVTHTNYLFIYFYFPTFQCYNYNKNYKDFRRKWRKAQKKPQGFYKVGFFN